MTTLHRIVIISFMALLSLGCCSWAAAQNSLMKPPPNCVVSKVDGVPFVRGELFLAEHADTISLVEFGFREFEYVGRSVGSVKYTARWPIATDLSALPMHVSGINYETWRDMEPAEDPYYDNSGRMSSQPMHSRDVDLCASSKSNAKRVARTVAARKDLYLCARDWSNLTMKPRSLTDIRNEERDAHPMLGTFRVLGDKRYPGNGNDYDRNDEPDLGTYYFMPGNRSSFRPVGSVTNRSGTNVGTFRTQPGRLIGTVYCPPSPTCGDQYYWGSGQTYYSTPGSRRTWTTTTHPRVISPAEWQRQHTRQRR